MKYTRTNTNTLRQLTKVYLNLHLFLMPTIKGALFVEEYFSIPINSATTVEITDNYFYANEASLVLNPERSTNDQDFPPLRIYGNTISHIN